MDIIDGHTHAFNLGFLPVEGVLLSRGVWDWLAAAVTDVFLKALERDPPGSRSTDEREALMAMLERELSATGAGLPLAPTPDLDLDLIAKFALMLPSSDLADLQPILDDARDRLDREPPGKVSAPLPELERLFHQRQQDQAEARLTVDRLLRTTASMAGPVETSHNGSMQLQATTGKTLGTLIDWLILLTQHEIRIARAFPLAWLPGSSFAARVHLMMDMENHYDGRPPEYRDIVADQFPRMLAAMEASPIEMIGFGAFDPFRTEDGIAIVRRGIEAGFVGVKFYPPNGYRPIGNKDEEIKQYRNAAKLTGADVDKANRDFFDWCIAGDVPVFTHCTSSGMESRPKETGKFSDPRGWQTLIESGFDNLRLCFGHAGGQDGWLEKHDSKFAKSYAKVVVDLCSNAKYNNLFCDFGYFDRILDKADAKRIIKRLERVIGANPQFAERCCYGTDWHLISADRKSPKYPSTFLSLIENGHFPEGFADRFFTTNAKNYLKIAS